MNVWDSDAVEIAVTDEVAIASETCQRIVCYAHGECVGCEWRGQLKFRLIALDLFVCMRHVCTVHAIISAAFEFYRSRISFDVRILAWAQSRAWLLLSRSRYNVIT